MAIAADTTASTECGRGQCQPAHIIKQRVVKLVIHSSAQIVGIVEGKLEDDTVQQLDADDIAIRVYRNPGCGLRCSPRVRCALSQTLFRRSAVAEVSSRFSSASLRKHSESRRRLKPYKLAVSQDL